MVGVNLMRFLLIAASAVALSGCSWLGHMSDADYQQYAQGSYGGSGSCAHKVYEPVPAGCWSQAMSHQTHSAPVQQQTSYVVQQQPTYVHSAPVQSAPVQSAPVQSTSTYTYPSQPAPTYQAPTQTHSYHAPQTTYQVPTYEQQPVYTTGGYGSHAGYHQSHSPLRGYYGMPKVKKPSRFYVSGYGGVNLQGEGEVEGVTSGFTTGNIGDGTTIVVPADTEYGWETDFDTGTAFGAEVGYRATENWRFGLEGSHTKADVDGHGDILLGGDDISALDAAALVGDATPLGATIGDFLADGTGDIEQKGVFLNAYYDFNEGSRFRPYLGAGVGLVDTELNYSPSGSPIIDDSATSFAYQGRAGASYNVSGPLDVFAEYTYRATEDLESDNLIFAGELEAETSQSLVTAGARYNF